MAFKMNGFSAFTIVDDKKTQSFIKSTIEKMHKDGKTDTEINNFIKENSDGKTEYTISPDGNAKAYNITKSGKTITNVNPEKGKSITD